MKYISVPLDICNTLTYALRVGTRVLVLLYYVKSRALEKENRHRDSREPFWLTLSRVFFDAFELLCTIYYIRYTMMGIKVCLCASKRNADSSYPLYSFTPRSDLRLRVVITRMFLRVLFLTAYVSMYL